jgi:hypothetical protein
MPHQGRHPMIRQWLVAALIPLSAIAAQAQVPPPDVDPADLETLILPFTVTRFGSLPGAHGSLWQTEIWIRNRGSAPVRMTQFGCIGPFPCYWLEIPPMTTTRLEDVINPAGSVTGHPGALLHVEPGLAGDLQLNMFIRDVSRSLETWGTEIPIVRESDLRSGPIDFLNVPNEDGFRVLLRAYHSSELRDAAITVRVFDLETDVLVGERDVPFILDGARDLQPYPGFAGTDISVGSFPGISGHSRLRVEVTPGDQELRFWAFISITRNETQHVTTITP